MDYETLGRMMQKMLAARPKPPSQTEWDGLRQLAAATGEKRYPKPQLRFGSMCSRVGEVAL